MINAKLILYTHQKITSKGYPIKIYVSEGKTKQKKYISLKIYSLEKDWNKVTTEPKKTHPNYLHVLDVVSEKKYALKNIVNQAYTNSWTFNKVVREIISPSSEVTLNSFWKQLCVEFKSLKLPKNQSYSNHLQIFNGYNSKVRFEEIDYNYLITYRDYKLRNGSNNGGVHSYLRTIRAVYNEAIRRGVFEPKSFVNPFKGVMPKLEKTQNKSLSVKEIRLIVDSEFEGQWADYRNYFLLCFYLGGIDFIDLRNLRYDEHVVDGRIRFKRFKKGHTKELINNKIFKEAQDILNKYDCKPYLVPIYKHVYNEYRKNFNQRLREKIKEIGVMSYFSSKSARYSFINIGKELLLNREVMEELTGHSKGDVHSIYEKGFPNEIKDEAHKKIIDSVFN